MSSGIQDFAFKEDLTYFINPEHTLKFGFNSTYHSFNPGERLTGDGEFAAFGDLVMEQKQSVESGLYLSSESRFGERFSAEYGLRLSVFHQLGEGWDVSYNEDNQRIDSTWYGKGELMQSYFSLEPVTVNQYSAGFYRNFLDNNLEFSAEAYYKDMRNVTDYEDGTDIFFNEDIEASIASGDGRSYGLELYLKKKYGRFTGWIYYTGNAVTFPSGKYEFGGYLASYYTERNGYRMPNYHRLDLNLHLASKGEGRFKSSWDFSVYNVYNRYNAYLIGFRESEISPGTTEAVKLSLFGIVPSFTWNFEF